MAMHVCPWNPSMNEQGTFKRALVLGPILLVLDRHTDNIHRQLQKLVFVKESRQVRVDQIVACINTVHGTAHDIVYGVLQFNNMCTRGIPHQLPGEL